MGECRGGEAGGPQWCTGGKTGLWVGGWGDVCMCAVCVCVHTLVCGGMCMCGGGMFVYVHV